MLSGLLLFTFTFLSGFAFLGLIVSLFNHDIMLFFIPKDKRNRKRAILTYTTLLIVSVIATILVIIFLSFELFVGIILMLLYLLEGLFRAIMDN